MPHVTRTPFKKISCSISIKLSRSLSLSPFKIESPDFKASRGKRPEGLPCCELQVTAAAEAHSPPFQLVFGHCSRSGSSPWQCTSLQWSLAVGGRKRGTACACPEILERDRGSTLCQRSQFSPTAVRMNEGFLSNV